MRASKLEGVFWGILLIAFIMILTVFSLGVWGFIEFVQWLSRQ